MNKALDCDQVFDVLTRGPFPTGDASDCDVEHHLACCHSCRQLAEALRPAVELFHEAIEPADSADLPGYRGELVTRSVGLAQLVVEAIAVEPLPHVAVARPRPARTTTWLDMVAESPLRLMTALACGALFAAAVWGAGLTGHSIPNRPSSAISLSDDGLVHLASLQLQPQCFTAPTALSKLQCCTECHSAKTPEPTLATRSLAVVASSCRACHP
jgi:hypothetical protein